MPAPRFHPFVRLLLCALGLIILQTVVVMGAAVIALPGAPLDKILAWGEAHKLPLTFATYFPSLAWIALCRLQFDARSWRSLGFRVSPRALANFGRGVLVGIAAFGLLWAILWISGAIVVTGFSAQAIQAGFGGSFSLLILYAALFLATGVFEETLFRGYITQNVSAWFGWGAAVVIQAILFAVVHLGNGLQANAATGEVALNPEVFGATLGALPSLALIGVFFALCWRKTGSLWFPIGFHFAWNWIQGCVLSLPVSGLDTFRLLEVSSNANPMLSGGGFGAEGSFYLIPILLALIWFIRAAPDHPQALLDLDLMRGEIPLSLLQTAPAPDEFEDEEPRTNRFGARFGSAQGFDSKMLLELQELAQQREKAAAEAAQEAQNQARVEFPAAIAEPPLAVEEPKIVIVESSDASESPKIAVEESPVAVEEPKISIAEPSIALEEAEIAVSPAPVVPLTPQTPTPEAPAPLPKKKSAPRW